MRVRIPKHWDDVTPQWMTAAMAGQEPDLKVAAVDLVTRDDGTNRRARFALEYSGTPGPSTVFLKAHTPKHRFVHLRNGNLFNEARLFASGVSLPLDHPRVYRSVVDYLRLDFLLVMEDLIERGADPRDATRPMTVEQVADGLRGLARLHSQYWGFSGQSHPGLRWVKTWQPSKGWLVGLRKRIPTGLDRAADSLSTTLLSYNTDAILDFWTRYVGSLSKGPMTLLHGDAHIGNTYVLPDNSVGFLDWQVVRRGSWSQDVGYFLVGSLTEQDCRRHEADLLEVYRTALDIPAAQRPSREEAWLHYCATPAYGLAIWLSTLGSEGYQSREISLALVNRYAAAFAELDTVAALARMGA